MDKPKNKTGYEGDPTQLKWYNSSRKCQVCGLVGFNKFICPYCIPIEQIQSRRNIYQKAIEQGQTSPKNN
jgi:hypothetical protein